MSFHSFIERTKALGIRAENRRKVTAQQMYPWAIERQLQEELSVEFQKAGVFYMREALRGHSYFYDSIDDLESARYNNDEVIGPIAQRVARQVEMFQSNTFANFTDTVIGARYIPPTLSTEITDTWEKNFMTLCRSANDEQKKKISEIVNNAVMNGNNISDTTKQIRSIIGKFSKSKASLIARTETAKLNMAISKAQMEECGIEYYEWACVLDERSRQSHIKMDGRICIWNNPNKYYNLRTHKVVDRPQSAVHLHPGDDYNCRCIALPWDPLIEEQINKKKGKPNEAWVKMNEEEKQKEAARRAEREEIKQNKIKVEQQQKQIEDLNRRLAELNQTNETLSLRLKATNDEIDILDDALALQKGGTHIVNIHVPNKDNPSVYEVVKVSINADTRQDAKYKVYMDILNNPDKYGKGAVVSKFNIDSYSKKNVKNVILTELEKEVPKTITEKTTPKKQPAATKTTTILPKPDVEIKSPKSAKLEDWVMYDKLKKNLSTYDMDELKEKMSANEKYAAIYSKLNTVIEFNKTEKTINRLTGKEQLKTKFCETNPNTAAVHINTSEIPVTADAVSHECAHSIHFKWAIQNKERNKAFLSDFEKAISDDYKKNKSAIKSSKKKISRDTVDDDISCLEDLISAASNGDLENFYGNNRSHSSLYYSSHPGSRSMEGFAEFLNLSFYKDTLEVAKKFFPQAYKVFDEFMKNEIMPFYGVD